jgi:hypothetical protein
LLEVLERENQDDTDDSLAGTIQAAE